MGDVDTGRLAGDEQAVGDLAVRPARGDEPKDLDLAGRQPSCRRDAIDTARLERRGDGDGDGAVGFTGRLDVQLDAGPPRENLDLRAERGRPKEDSGTPCRLQLSRHIGLDARPAKSRLDIAVARVCRFGWIHDRVPGRDRAGPWLG